MIAYIKKLIFLITILLLCGFFWDKIDWNSVNNTIDRLYPSVASITTDSLKTQIQSRKDLTIIDVRSSEEYKISHLPRAINLTDEKKLKRPKNTTIIVYCSVGIRSAHFSKKLEEEGYTRVFNLRGSIFEWANKGYPLKRGEQNVTVVHPYNKKWGQLLDASFHAYEAN
ncbi:MAG: rhodanese-related sulfurtransferase [Desulforhopalus sp.]|jgi:rhodanese-related sulfurtransferase